MKAIILSAHALSKCESRGFTPDDVVEAIRHETWVASERGRLECRRDVIFASEWNGQWYATRQIRPIFVEEPYGIVVVTVYTYYF